MQRRSALATVLLGGLVMAVLLAGSAAAHQQGTPKGWTKLIYDCPHDWGWESSKPLDKGHELTTLSVVEEVRDGVPMVVFEMSFVKAPPVGYGAPYRTWERVSFDTPRLNVTTWFESTTEETLTVTGGTPPAFVSDRLFAPDATGTQRQEDGIGLSWQFGYTYDQLQVQQGEPLMNFEMEAYYEDLGTRKPGDYAFGGFTGMDGEWFDGCYRPDEPGSHYTRVYPITESDWTVGGEGADGAEDGATVQPPKVDFSFVPASPRTGDTVTFTDTSVAEAGNLVRWRWDFGDGSGVRCDPDGCAAWGGASIDGDASTKKAPVHAYAKSGDYIVTLEVVDDADRSATLRKALTVLNRPPTAGFAPSTSEPAAGEEVRFVDGSTDPDGRITAWSWRFGDGNASTEPSPTHRYARPGEYTVILNVTDDAGETSEHATTIRVTAPDAEDAPQPPIAHFDMEGEPVAGRSVRFMDASRATEGAIVERTWDFGNGQRASCAEDACTYPGPDGSDSNRTEGLHPRHTYEKAGTYTVSLTITDEAGSTMTAARIVEVARPENLRPVAGMEVLVESTPRSGDAIQFMDASHDPDGSIVAWAWDFGDGTASAERNPTHAFKAAGTYEVALVVMDDSGARQGTLRRVEVVDPAAPGGTTPENARPPLADFTVTPENATTLDLLTFRDTTRPRGAEILTQDWDFGDGTTTFGNEATHRYAKSGPYLVTLRVRDTAGNTAQVVKEVIVANVPPTASISYEPSEPVAGEPVRFVSRAEDPDGTITLWDWYFADDGATTAAEAPVHVFRAAGIHVVSLTVTDDAGSWGRARVEVAVAPAADVEGAQEALAEREAPVPALLALVAFALVGGMRRLRGRSL